MCRARRPPAVHSLAVEAIRAGLIAWFAAGDRYWPHEKRLSQRLQLLGHPDLAELERRAWLGETLAVRLAAIRELLARLNKSPLGEDGPD